MSNRCIHQRHPYDDPGEDPHRRVKEERAVVTLAESGPLRKGNEISESEGVGFAIPSAQRQGPLLPRRRLN